MRNKVDATERRIEREFMRFGKKLAVPVHDRIRELIKELSPTFPITGLDMMMGTYCLRGKDFQAIYSDGSEGEVPMEDLLDFDEGKGWTPISVLSGNLPKKDRARLIELRETLDYLTDAPYLPLLQLKAKDLK